MTRTSGGNLSLINLRATSLPKASSPRKMLPIPATRILLGLLIAMVQLHRRRRRSDVPAVATSPDPFRDPHPAPGPGKRVSQHPARSTRSPRFYLPERDPSHRLGPWV